LSTRGAPLRAAVVVGVVEVCGIRMSPMDGDELMSRSLRTPRAAAIAGVLFALLLVATLTLIRLATPSGRGRGRRVAQRPEQEPHDRPGAGARTVRGYRVSVVCRSRPRSDRPARGPIFRHGVSG